MINDSALGDRLNLFREGQINEESPKDYYKELGNVDRKLENLVNLAFKILDIGIVFLRSLTYGFAAKTIFATDWKFVAFLAVGFSIDLILNNLTNIFNREDK